MSTEESQGGVRKSLTFAARRVTQETGLTSLYSSPFDVKLLCLQRFVRQFAYGQSTLILVSFFNERHVAQSRIGLFMTLTLAGDIFISFFLTLFADAIGRRAILALGAAMMTASGIVFATCENYWVLLAAAVLGVISPSGNEIGPFRAVEESSLAHLTAADIRPDIYAWYSLIGTSGAALGILSCGWLVHHLHNDLHWDHIPAYQLIFYLYAGFGIFKVILALSQSSAVEADKPEPEVSSESEPLLPSAILLALIPIPNDVHLSTLFLILRSCIQSMDIAPRSAFLAAIVLPQERTAILGTVNVVKTLAQSMGPFITGILAQSSLFWVSFVCAGSLKVCYDLGLLALFKNHERTRARTH